MKTTRRTMAVKASMACIVLAAMVVAGTAHAEVAGTQTYGGVNFASLEDKWVAVTVSMPEAGDIVSATVMLNFAGNNSSQRSAKFFLLDLDGTVLATSPEQSISISNKWWEAIFDDTIAVTSGTYWVGAWLDGDSSGGAAVAGVRAFSSGGRLCYDTLDYDGHSATLPSTLDTTSNHLTWDMSAFVTYRVSNSVTITTTVNNIYDNSSAPLKIGQGGDCYIDNGLGADTKNYGAATALYVWEGGAFNGNKRMLMAVPQFANYLPSGVTIDTAQLYLYCTTNTTNSDTVAAFRLWKPFFQQGGGGGAGDTLGATFNSWNKISAAADSTWGVAGADSVNDAGSENRAVGDQADRAATKLGWMAVTATGAVHMDIDVAMVEDWRDTTAQPYGMIFVDKSSSTGNNRFASIEDQDGTHHAYWRLVYSSAASATATPTRRRRLLLGGQR